MGKNDSYWAWSYVDDKLCGAVDILATSFAPNWQRMEYALAHLTALLPSHFPEADLHGRYERLMKEATVYGPLMIGDRAYRGSIENTLRRRKRVTFERYAQELVELSKEVHRRCGSYSE